MKFDRTNVTLIVIGSMILIGFITSSIFHISFGFEITEELEKESRILAECITLNITNEKCTMLYGDLENGDQRID
jgi:hypothetical protein